VSDGPEISIGLPVYNGDKYLDQAITSIASQSFSDFELIIADNCSTDDSLMIAKSWAEADSRIRVLESEENLGAAPNFNRVFRASTGEYFKWAACDDILQQDFLEKCIRQFEARPDTVLVYSDALDIDDNGAVIGPIYDSGLSMRVDSDDPVTRFRDLVLPNHSCIAVFGLMRRSILDESGLIGPFVGSDRVLLAQLALMGPFSRINEPLILHREHSDRSTRSIPRPQDRLSWFDSSLTKSRVFPHWRILTEYVSCVLSARLTMRHKVRSCVHLLRWIRWGGWRNLWEDLF